MEKGKTYEVYYKDDTQVRHKTLKYKEAENDLLTFLNIGKSNKREIGSAHFGNTSSIMSGHISRISNITGTEFIFPIFVETSQKSSVGRQQ